jgi:uncharacterized iron-regulated membrane protein
MTAISAAMRQFFIVFHRWAALAALVFILLLGITGSALVFEGAMDRGLHPELWRVHPSGRPLPLDTLIAHARAAVPGPTPTGVTLSPVDDRADVVQAGINQIFVDRYTGHVLGHRTVAEWNETLPRRLHVLHVTLMSGKIGGEIMAIATIVSLVLVLSGIYLWWGDKIWRVRWSASWKRVVFDLHHQLGIVAAIVLVLITASGLVIHYRALNNLVYRLDRTAPEEILDQLTPASPSASISVDSLQAVALHALPGARVMFLTLSPKRDDPFVAAMRFPEDHTPGGRSRVYVDRYTGAVLGVENTRRAQMGTRIGNQIRSIHTGDWFGKPTEVVWLVAALALVGQAITGLLMWWNGRRSRAALKRADAGRSGQTRRDEHPEAVSV